MEEENSYPWEQSVQEKFWDNKFDSFQLNYISDRFWYGRRFQ